VSEIVGYDAVGGKKTSSRIDPLSIELVAKVYKRGDWWTADDSKADRDAGSPIPYGPTGEKSKGRASLIIHGNVLPSISEGGYTISHAIQTTVLSLIALRRLHFPAGKAKPDPATDHATQAMLAALALCAITYQREEGYDLRSRCVLIPTGPAQFELVGSDATQLRAFDLDVAGATALFREAVTKLPAALSWKPRELALKPSDDVLQLIRISRELDTAPGRSS
jgi:CRISPR-associated protein Csb1